MRNTGTETKRFIDSDTNCTEAIVHSFITHLSQRHLEELLELFAEKVDWYVPGDALKATWLGQRTEKTELRDFFQLLWRNTMPVAATIEQVFIQGNSACLIGEFSTRMLPTNKIVHSPFAIFFQCEHNRIVKYRLLEDSFAVSLSMC